MHLQRQFRRGNQEFKDRDRSKHLANGDAIEAALASALAAAAAASRFDVVAQLAREIEARRVTDTSSFTLDTARPRPEQAQHQAGSSGRQLLRAPRTLAGYGGGMAASTKPRMAV